jgi:hypothetical protein
MDIAIARPSVASLLLQAEANSLPLSTATGFVVSRDNQTHLVTNRHVVRGRHQTTDIALHPSGGVPDSLRVIHHAAGKLGTPVEKVEKLHDNSDRPLWFEHPLHKDKVDVVALPLTDLTGVDIHPYDPWAQTRVRIGPTEPLNIMGFPFGITGGGALAIWVRGFVATEVTVDFDNLPCFLIDSRTRPGQSGSPVIFYGGSFTSATGALVVGGTVEEFVGVYSGRINPESDLGVVWKASVVREIVQAKERPAPA